jgi:hypothetical protein
MKKCSNCRIEKELDQFGPGPKRKGGGRYVASHCHECRRLLARTRYKDKGNAYWEDRRDFHRLKLFEYWQTHSCIDCGISNPVVLEFDHRDPAQKKANISTLISSKGRWEDILEEIEKCDVVCANCHKIRTAKQQGWTKIDIDGFLAKCLKKTIDKKEP